MSYKYLILIINITLMAFLKNYGQVEIVDRKSPIVFYDSAFHDTVKVSAVVRVSFNDSINLHPECTFLTIFIMKEVGISSDSSSINFTYCYSCENELSDFEHCLMKKYSTKIDSIFLNSEYRFTGERIHIPNLRVDFAFGFKIYPLAKKEE